MKLDTEILGGISTSIWMWSGHTSASIIRTPFHSHSCRSILPISALFSPKNTFLRYFGANTIWYLQFHFVCDKLITSFLLIVNDLLCCFYLCSWQPHSYYTTKEFLCHYQLCNSYRTTRLTRGFTIQKGVIASRGDSNFYLYSRQ